MKAIFKGIFKAGFLTLCFTSQLHAATHGVDNLCSKSSGHWRGLFVLKDESTCLQYKGCAHFISADVTDLGSNAYQMLLQPDLSGTGGPIPIECDNGKITSSKLPPGSAGYVNCSANGNCTIDFESPFVFVYLHKAP